MYKCISCGHIFDEGEQKTIQENHPYGDTTAPEYFSVCPCCGCDFEKTKRCEKCGGEFLEDELFCGYYCKKCLRDALTTENFLWFATEDGQNVNKIDTLEDFVFTKVFGLSRPPAESSSNLKKWCRKIYMLLDSESTIKLIFEYMDEIPSLWDDFAEYLNEKEAKKNENKNREAQKKQLHCRNLHDGTERNVKSTC